MWLVFSLVSLFTYTIADLFGKKSVDEGNIFKPIELTISSSCLSFIVSLLFFALGLGESGLTPWELIIQNPLFLLNLLCFFIQWMLFLFSMRFIKMSILQAIEGSQSIFFFLGLILINLLFDILPQVENMLHPLRLVAIIIILAGIIIYPNVDRIGKRRIETPTPTSKAERRNFFIGLFLLFLSLVFDTLDSLLVAVILDDGSVGVIDCVIANYFSTIIPIVFFSVFLRIKTKKWFIPIKHDNRYSIGYCISSLISSQLYILASHFDAVRTGIIFLIYPILPILGAKLFLKEKNTWRQNVCIWAIVLAAIAFCALDYIL